MPNMLVTPKMCEAMGEVLLHSSLTSEEKGLLENIGTTAKSYPMQVIELILKKHPSNMYLHELLAESSVEPPPPPPERKRNPELVKRLDKIRTYLEDREYDEMVKDVRRGEIDASNLGEMRSLSSQLGEGVNIIVAKATAFAVGFYASKALYGDDPVYNTIAGLVGLIVGLAVEACLYVA
eukprot:CAMPEP_0172184328 /NCGR_PEP_ID=MMETSP1050-20130122/19510_1 /TAXON_ID=233186 /ORGANISM="Cryptomonas curvata, Strain CCAP979/52" /LENGTH=179 /DNA_ID=CAMNT_0012858105 /DNA_START=48 /DNA_END=583 /DNA_ORIENTATION=-